VLKSADLVSDELDVDGRRLRTTARARSEAPDAGPALHAEARPAAGGLPEFPHPRVSPENVLGLQTTLGNSAVNRLLSAGAGVETVRPVLHAPPGWSRAGARAAAPTAEVEDEPAAADVLGGTHTSAEAQAATLDPVDSEDEKTNYLAATTPTLNDLTPTGSSGLTTIKIGDVAITGEVFDDSGSWKIRVTAASTTIHWGINTGGYSIPDPRDGGNITQANWRTVVTELQGYQARQASGSWHHPDASTTHEQNHVSWFRAEILRTWPAIETDIQSHVLGASGGTDAGAGMSKPDAQAAMATYLDQKRRDWFNAYGVAPEPPAYAAGQAVLNGIVTQVQTYAHSKGWDAADAGAP